MYIPKILSAIFVVLGLVLGFCGFYFYDGYSNARKKGEDIGYFEYVGRSIREIKSSASQMGNISAQAYKSADEISAGSMLKIQQALIMYNMNNGTYPEKISDLIGNYLSASNNMIYQENFEYHKTQGGYYMSAVLPVSGKKYVIQE